MEATTAHSQAERILLPYDEVQHALGGIGRTTLHELINGQKLDRRRIGRRSFVTRESLDRYVASIAAT